MHRQPLTETKKVKLQVMRLALQLKQDNHFCNLVAKPHSSSQAQNEVRGWVNNLIGCIPLFKSQRSSQLERQEEERHNWLIDCCWFFSPSSKANHREMGAKKQIAPTVDRVYRVSLTTLSLASQPPASCDMSYHPLITYTTPNIWLHFPTEMEYYYRNWIVHPK